MIVVDPNDRLSMDDVLAHPWFVDARDQTAPMSTAASTNLTADTAVEPDAFGRVGSCPTLDSDCSILESEMSFTDLDDSESTHRVSCTADRVDSEDSIAA